MKFSNLLVIAVLFGAADAIKLTIVKDDEEEKDPDADAKQPKKIDPATLGQELKEAAAAEAAEKEKAAKAMKL